MKIKKLISISVLSSFIMTGAFANTQHQGNSSSQLESEMSCQQKREFEKQKNAEANLVRLEVGALQVIGK